MGKSEKKDTEAFRKSVNLTVEINMNNKVSVIIPTFNRAQYIGLTIDSFIRQTYDKERLEIIVCDNHSTDNTKSVIQKIVKENPSVCIKYLYEDRQGVHYTRNTAAMQATGDILYFTDDDMIADEYMLERLIGLFDKFDNLGAVTGRVIPKWEVNPPAWVERYLNNQWLSLIDRNMEICITDYDLGVYSCHEAIKKEIFMKTGGFHPENTAGEWVGDGETGFNMEVQEMGCHFGYVGSALTEHIIPSGRMTQKYLNKRLYNQGCSDSYTAYRKCIAQKGNFKAGRLKYCVPLLKKWVRTLYQAVRKKTSIRFMVSFYYYYKARTEYDMRLMSDEKWRAMVLRTNWLE